MSPADFYSSLTFAKRKKKKNLSAQVLTIECYYEVTHRLLNSFVDKELVKEEASGKPVEAQNLATAIECGIAK